MLSVDFNEVSAVNAGSHPIERVYVGSDIAWMEDEQMRFIVELSGGQLCAFSLSEIDEASGLDMFMMTWNQTFWSPFSEVFGRYISRATPVVKIRDNQSTDEYGINGAIYCVSYLSDMVEAVFPKATVVSQNAFRICKSLQRVCLTNVSAVYDEAFAGCGSLTSIQLPKLQTLGDSAFWDCSSLVSADFGLLECVPHDAFRNIDGGDSHSNIRSVSIPHALCADDAAFQESRKLETVYSPSLQHIGIYAFQNCSSLYAIDFENVVDVQRSGMENVGVEVADLANCTFIGDRAFAFSKNLKYLYAPHVKTIEQTAFWECSSLSNAIIPEVETIGSYAFCDCSLRDVTLKHVKFIGKYGLSCSALSSITLYNTLEDGMPTISTDAFPRRCKVYVDNEDIYEQMCTSSSLSSSEDRVILLGCKDQKTALTAQDFQIGRVIYQELTTDKTSKKLAATYDGGSTLEKPFSQLFDPTTGYTFEMDAASYLDIRDAGSEISALDDGCFQNFTRLSSLHLPSCIEIGEYSLGGCSSLVDLDLRSLQTAATQSFYKIGVSALELPSLTSISNSIAEIRSLEVLKLPLVQDLDGPLFVGCQNLKTLELQSLSSITFQIVTDNLANLTRLVLPSMTGFDRPLTMPNALPSALVEIDLASISYDDFAGSLSARVARGFAPGCTLTCSDGVYVIA